MTNSQELMKIAPHLRPILFEGDTEAIGSAVLDWAASGLTVRVVRGRKMRDLPSLLDECSAAFQFPLYFGDNVDAFNEGIAELENLPSGAGFVVVIAEPDQVLAVDGHREFAWFALSLANAAEVWGRAVNEGEWWDRPAIPFHVVLAGQSGELEPTQRRWSAAGFDGQRWGEG